MKSLKSELEKYDSIKKNQAPTKQHLSKLGFNLENNYLFNLLSYLH